MASAPSASPNPVAATATDIRLLAREIVQTHRRLYTLQTELKGLTGFEMAMDFYEGLLMAGDDEPISDDEMDDALSHAEREGTPAGLAEADPAVIRFRAMFPEAV